MALANHHASVEQPQVEFRMKLKRLRAEFEIVTPMFLGGADQQATRIRESSIKGALAFWWRALNYAGEVANKNHDAALKSLQEKEQRLFGGRNGQGAFLLRVISEPSEKDILKPGVVLAKTGSGLQASSEVVGEGARYLGYGLINAFYAKAKEGKPEKKAGELERSCFSSASKLTFTIELVFRRTVNDGGAEQLINALKLFGLLGGLGSRVRRGWGSVSLISMEASNPDGSSEHGVWQCPTDVNSYKEALRGIISETGTCGTDFPLTTFAPETDIRIGKSMKVNALDVLDELGSGFHRYRGWRGNGEKKFQNDHDWYRENNGVPNRIADRAAFGLPHNYSKYLGITASNTKRDDVVAELDRRASPLFFHVQRLGNGECVGVASVFPVQFLPTQTAAVWRKPNSKIEKTDVDYNFIVSGLPIILHYLNGQKPDGSKSSEGPYFPATKVWP